MKVQDIIKQISLTTKRNKKIQILKNNKNNETLRGVLLATYNLNIIYWIAKHPQCNVHTGEIDLLEAISQVNNNLVTRKVTGNKAIEFYQNILSSLTEEDASLLQCIIDRDLRCGIGAPTINKIWPKLIPTFDLLLSGKNPKYLKFPDVCCQLKYDGLRIEVFHDNDDIVLRTRSGKVITSLEKLYPYFRKVIPLGQAWDGELVCKRNGKFLPRKTSNGICNKAIRNTISEKEIDLIHFICWDVVDKTRKIPYRKRFESVEKRLSEFPLIDKIILAESHLVSSLEDIKILFQKALERGEEGVIAKNLDSFWKPTRSNDLCKFKAELTADLVVTGWIEGTGKYKGMLGSLSCETSDGKIKVDIGYGYSDKQRKEFTPNITLDKIVEVLYNCRITKDGRDTESLYLARFIKFRPDKDVANSSDEVE
jgi:DNA ligase-1